MNSIYDYVREEESRFETDEIQVGENWSFNLRKHVQLIFHLMNGVFYTGENDLLRTFKQVMRPLIRLSIWTEDLEVKDIVFFIENQTGRALSFLVKKYHDEVYVKEHDLDTLFDEITESDIAYGAALVQKGVKRPEIVHLQSIAFCDQTDLLGGPIGFKHNFSPSKLKSMSKYGWGEEKNGATISLEDLCYLATEDKDTAGTLNTKKNKVPGKTIKVYIIRGDLPESYLKDDGDEEYNVRQLQIIAFYTDKNNNEEGVTLYRKLEKEGNLELHISEKIYGRALGYSDGEALIHPQIWTNFASIHKMNFLETASKVPLVTDDPNWSRQKIQDMERNLEVTTIGEGKTVKAIQTAFTGNYNLFASSVNELYESGQINVQGFDTLMGKEESAGITFRGQERLVAQGRGWHDRRRGQRAKFIERLYRNWIIPDMVKEILNGKKFLASLSTEEMVWVADQVTTSAVNRKINDLVLEGKKVTKEEQSLMTEVFKQNLLKKGNRQLLEILKDEFRDIEIKIGVNVAGKQKNLSAMSDKLLSILQNAMGNPQGFQLAMQNPALSRAFENILEYSNVPIPDFYSLINSQPIISPVQPEQLEAPEQTNA